MAIDPKSVRFPTLLYRAMAHIRHELGPVSTYSVWRWIVREAKREKGRLEHRVNMTRRLEDHHDGMVMEKYRRLEAEKLERLSMRDALAT
jgi:hypothetical protein